MGTIDNLLGESPKKVKLVDETGNELVATCTPKAEKFFEAFYNVPEQAQFESHRIVILDLSKDEQSKENT